MKRHGQHARIRHRFSCRVLLLLAWLGTACLGVCRPPGTAVASAGADGPKVSTVAGPSPIRQRLAGQTKDQLLAGDYYTSPAGKKHLSRLAGSMVIRFHPEIQKDDGARVLASNGGPLAAYHFEAELPSGALLFTARRSEREKQKLEPLRLQQAIASTRQLNVVRSANPVFIDAESGLARLATEEIIVRLEPQTDAQTFFGSRWPQVKPLHGTTDRFILTLPLATAEETLARANQLAADTRVIWAEPNFLSQVRKEASEPLFFGQWNLQNSGLNGALPFADINAPGAWTNSTGNPGIVIAVLDDGAQLDHPDLRANLFSNPGELSNGLDDDQNGYVDDFHGWNFFRDDNDPSPEAPEDEHGTGVAGVAIAPRNGIGLAGVAYNCHFMPLKVVGGGRWASDSALAQAVYYAAGRTRDGSGLWNGADVICISLSFPQSSAVDDALTWAAANGRGGKGCPIFAAAGDDASRWRPSRVRLPVGMQEGAGAYQFGFEYSKDVDTSEGEDLIKIDNVALLGGDGVTQVLSALGASGRQDFEGVFPPLGWQLVASQDAPFWNATTNNPLTGTRGAISAQSGPIIRNQWTELRTPVVTLLGSETLSFSCYLSSEQDYDGLKVWVYDANGNYVDVFAGPLEAPLLSGNPPISSSVHYPASHPAVSAVGASTDCDVRADYSQSGPGLDFVAPSSGGWNDIITTDLTSTNGSTPGDYVYDFGGTSAACPLAAGIAALVLSANPALSASDVRSILRNSCDKIGGVAYDPSGWNTSYGYGRLNAQRATAAATVTTNRVFLSGTVFYPTNYPTTAPSAVRVPGATMSLAGDAIQSIPTANDGTFRFAVPAPGNFTITPSLTGDTPVGNGISTLDISLVRRHVLNLTTLDSPYKLLAADVNGSQSISTLDISLMRRLVLAVTNTFPAGLWRLVPADYTFPDPLNPWNAPSARSYPNLLRDHTNQNFVAIKLGDVNSSWAPTFALPPIAAKSPVRVKEIPQVNGAGSPGPEVGFEVECHSAGPGETVLAGIAVSKFQHVTSVQFTLTWNPAVLEYKSAGDFALNNLSDRSFSTHSAGAGMLAFSWDDGAGVTMEDHSRLFTLKFKGIGPLGSASSVALTDSIAAREVGVNFFPGKFLARDGWITVGATISPP